MSTDTHSTKRAAHAARTKDDAYVFSADELDRMLGGHWGTGGTFGRVVVDGRGVRSPASR